MYSASSSRHHRSSTTPGIVAHRHTTRSHRTAGSRRRTSQLQTSLRSSGQWAELRAPQEVPAHDRAGGDQAVARSVLGSRRMTTAKTARRPSPHLLSAWFRRSRATSWRNTSHPTTPHAPTPRAARHPGHDPALAPPAGHPPLDNDAQPDRAARHPRRSPRPGTATCHRESGLGLPAGPRRAHRPRLPDRRLHRLDHPAQRRHRPLTATSRTVVDRVPARAGARDPGLRLVPVRHEALMSMWR